MGSGSSSEKIPKGYLITTFQGHSDGINSMALSDNGYLLVTAGDDKTGKVWDAKEGQGFRKLGDLIGHNGYISCILIVGDYILTGSSDKTVRKWDVENDFKCIVQCNGHSSLIHRMICNGAFIFTSSFDHTARCFAFDTGQCLRVFKGHKRGVYPLLFIPTEDEFDDDDYADVDLAIGILVTGSADNTARSWNCDTGQKINIFKSHNGPITCLATDETSTYLLTGSTDQSIIMWNLATAKPLKICQGHENSLICMQVLGDKLYSGSSDGTVREWVYKHGKCSMVMRNHTRTVTSIKVVVRNEVGDEEKAVNKRYVFTGCGDNMIRCFDPASGRLIRNFPGHTNSITAIRVHGDRLYTASYDGTVKLWYAFTGNNQNNNNNCVTKETKQLLKQKK